MGNGPDTLYQSNIPGLKRLFQGKVRDIYAVDDRHMLIVTTDRLSAFDVILPDPIPGKGRVLSEISNFWFKRLEDTIPNHLTDLSPADVLPSGEVSPEVESRSVVVKRLNALPIEAVCRGYLIGSGWKDYQHTGQVCGIDLPKDLRLAEQLPEPIYTPATKADVGDHDENIDFETTAGLIGRELAEKVRDTALTIYRRAARYALSRGIIIADTKLEFGLDDANNLILIDEVLTPDSSRFWPVPSYRPGISPPSFDKQFVRDYLETLDWDKREPGPHLPIGVIRKTSEKYQEALKQLAEPNPQ